MRRLCIAVGIFNAIAAVLGVTHLLAQTEKQRPQSTTDIVLSGDPGDWPTRDRHPLVLPDGRLLMSVDDSVYMLDANGKELWKYKQNSLSSEPAFNPARNEVAVIMYDLMAVRLDATTGKVKWKADVVGRGSFADIQSYDKGFLVVMNMSGYRNKETPRIPDRLEYWGDSEKDFWYMDFPPKAELIVNGTRIFSLTRGKDRLRLRELRIIKNQ